MKQVRDIMGMPVAIEIAGEGARQEWFDQVFDYFERIDERFSTYKEASEISRINRGGISPGAYSEEMKEVFALSEETKRSTDGYFDIRRPDGSIDPSGLVKGWAIRNAANLLLNLGCSDSYVDAGGDIQSHGKNNDGKEWAFGIRNPFKCEEIIKVLEPRGQGIATSGTYIRGRHIYDPHTKREVESAVVSITVVGPDVYEADRFATAAFAMGERGIAFIEELEGFEGYAIDQGGMATMTSGFERYVI